MLKNVLQICTVVGVISVQPSTSVKIPLQTDLSWAMNVMQSGASAGSIFKNSEPGFDLTNDEIKKLKLWPRGKIPYYIDTISFDKVLRDRIRNFLYSTGGLTGLQFMELPSPPPEDGARWVFFINRRGMLGCADFHSSNFTNDGVQKVVLGYECLNNKGQMAEMVLVLAGVAPQHTSPDRDEYIKVNMDKIIPEKRYLYEKLKDSDWLFHDLNYDFASAGHYNFHKHTIDGTATITPKEPVEVLVGEVNGFSNTDILKIRMLYKYMRSKLQSQTKAIDCVKLFKTGSKIGNYYAQKMLQIKPRKKPNKYLGVQDKTETNTKNHNNLKEEDSQDADNNKRIDDDANKNSKTTGKRNGKLKLKLAKYDPLTYLSDYETESSHENKGRTRQLLFGRRPPKQSINKGNWNKKI